MTMYKGHRVPLSAETFRAFRELAGLTQPRAAELLSVAERSVRRWESEESDQTPPITVCEWLIDRWEWVRTQAEMIAAKQPEVVWGYGPVVKQVLVAIQNQGGTVHVGADCLGVEHTYQGERLAWAESGQTGDYCRLTMEDRSMPMVKLGPVKHKNARWVARGAGTVLGDLRTYVIAKAEFADWPED